MLMQQVSPNPFVQLFVEWPLLRKQRRSTLLWSRKSRAHTRRQSGKALAISTSKSTNAFGASASWSPLFAKGAAMPTLPVSVDGRSQLQAHGQKVPCVCNVFRVWPDHWSLGSDRMKARLVDNSADSENFKANSCMWYPSRKATKFATLACDLCSLLGAAVRNRAARLFMQW